MAALKTRDENSYPPGTLNDIIYNSQLVGNNVKLNNPNYHDFLKCLSNTSKENALELYDATNACVFLSIDIIQTIFCEGKIEDIDGLISKVQDIIITRPRIYNNTWNKSSYYDISEALECMKNPLIYNGSLQFRGSSPGELKEKISNFVFNAVNTTKDIYFVYFCKVYAFPFAILDGRLYLIDTHKVTPENGIVCCLSSNSGDMAKLSVITMLA